MTNPPNILVIQLPRETINESLKSDTIKENFENFGCAVRRMFYVSSVYAGQRSAVGRAPDP